MPPPLSPEPSKPVERPSKSIEPVHGDGSSPKSGEDKTTLRSAEGAETDLKPDYLKNPAPHYPERARRLGQEGLVVLHAKVDEAGHPEEVLVKQSSGFLSLDNAAVEAVKRWQFRPAVMGSLPISSDVEIPIRFKIK